MKLCGRFNIIKIEKEIPFLLHAEENLKKLIKEDSTHKYYLLTVRFGLKTYYAYLDWCKDALETLRKDSE